MSMFQMMMVLIMMKFFLQVGNLIALTKMMRIFLQVVVLIE